MAPPRAAANAGGWAFRRLPSHLVSQRWGRSPLLACARCPLPPPCRGQQRAPAFRRLPSHFSGPQTQNCTPNWGLRTPGLAKTAGDEPVARPRAVVQVPRLQTCTPDWGFSTGAKVARSETSSLHAVMRVPWGPLLKTCPQNPNLACRFRMSARKGEPSHLGRAVAWPPWRHGPPARKTARQIGVYGSPRE